MNRTVTERKQEKERAQERKKRSSLQQSTQAYHRGSGKRLTDGFGFISIWNLGATRHSKVCEIYRATTKIARYDVFFRLEKSMNLCGQSNQKKKTACPTALTRTSPHRWLRAPTGLRHRSRQGRGPRETWQTPSPLRKQATSAIA